MPAREELDRVASGVHPEPHAVLGPHPSGDGFVVRCFRPRARTVALVLASGARVEARRVHERGIFAAELDHHPGTTYRVIADGDAARAERDAYAFAPTVGAADLALFAEGRHDRLYDVLGAHLTSQDGVAGVRFAVWAPNALSVRVAGDFNAWSGEASAMRRLDAGVFELFLPGIVEGALYKLEVVTRKGSIMKADPFGRQTELRPETASRVVRSRYTFRDEAFVSRRAAERPQARAVSIYEVHLPSWRRKPVGPGDPSPAPGEKDGTRWLTYRELADELVPYVVDMGFTHVEVLPIMEYPYDGSWGYQVSGYFAPTSRLGAPDDFRYFVDRCHEAGLFVLLDWVPAHFPRDAAALGRFDGTPLYEHWDPRRGEHRQWETFVFDWGKPQVKNFLVASALYWIDQFHVDGLRVDAVASMLYLDFGAEHASEWEPNVHGGRENLEAVAFLRDLCDRVHDNFPGAILCAEESTSWPGVTHPTYAGGLGFDLKWDMGFMHDTLGYFALDPIFRNFNHALLTFGLMYVFSERHLLPLSHDEVVHLKKALLQKMSGDAWQRRANLRALYGYMWAHPGKKLLFMGGELGQLSEWSFATELEWHLLDDPGHRGIKDWVRDLNRLYVATPALFEIDHRESSFRWIDANDQAQSVASFIRFGSEPAPRAVSVGAAAPEMDAAPPAAIEDGRAAQELRPHVVFVGNFTPVIRDGYRIGVPGRGAYREALNSDAEAYGGSNVGNLGRVVVEDVPSHGFERSIVLRLPPLATLFLVPDAAD